MDLISRIFIYYIHAPLGALALLAGAVALASKKGEKVHKKSGKLFYYSMLGSALASFVIATLPDHESPFLLAIGLFSSYFLVSGYRSLRFKESHPNLRVDKGIAIAIALIGSAMVVLPVVLLAKINIVLTVFGVTAVVFGIRDLRMFRDSDQLRMSWLKLHLGKMTGGYIAAVSAFCVVNDIFPGIWNWFIPSIFGSFFIAYWMRKQNRG